MKVLTPGHRYELANCEQDLTELNQNLQFIQKQKRCEPDCQAVLIQGAECNCEPKFVTVRDGTTNEEVLAVLIDRLNSLNAKLPNRHTELAMGMCQVALELLNMRTAEWKARNVEGTPKA